MASATCNERKCVANTKRDLAIHTYLRIGHEVDLQQAGLQHGMLGLVLLQCIKEEGWECGGMKDLSGSIDPSITAATAPVRGWMRLPSMNTSVTCWMLARGGSSFTGDEANCAPFSGFERINRE